MNSEKTYRVIVIGPTGAGKSQFCNFVRRDKSNSINKVSDSLDSCTQDPFSNTFQDKVLIMNLLILQEIQIHQIMILSI